MKMKIIFFALMMFAASIMTVAQTLQEVVYLKNGSVIRGVIVEQVLNVSLKIQTADDSIFAYQMDREERKRDALNFDNIFVYCRNLVIFAMK